MIERKFELNDGSKKTVEDNPEIMKKWIAGLRSGKYTQITDIMCSKHVENSACCLHVLEMECNGRHWEAGFKTGLPSSMSDALVFDDGTFPEDLETVDGMSPSSWNDDFRLSFEDIAELLEKGMCVKKYEGKIPLMLE